MKTVKSIRGNVFEVVGPLPNSVGGQSQSLDIATRVGGNGTHYVIKWLAAVEVDGRARNEVLMEHTGLQQLPSVIAPKDVVIGPMGETGIVTPLLTNARPLADLIANPLSPREHLLIALQQAFTVAKFDSLGLCHGDQGNTNTMIQSDANGATKAVMLDLDNATGLGLPPARMIGQEFYYAPERHDNRAQPSSSSEAYSLAVLMHELVLGAHPFGADGITADVARFMPWRFDPLGEALKLPAGYDVRLAHPALIDAFRETLQPDPTLRHLASTWWGLLRDLVAQDRLVTCMSCGRHLHLHQRLQSCPHCAASFERGLIGPTGEWMPVKTELVVGRDQCGGDPCVSRQHLVLRRHGPELMAKVFLGVNQSWVLLAQGWQALTDRWVTLPGGSVLRLHQVELQVQ